MPPKSIPPQFQVETNAIASYSYTDIAEGTGIQIFYGLMNSDSSGDSYVLSSESISSSEIFTQASTTGSEAKVLDLDFDLAAFNLPRTIKGTAHFNIPIKVTCNANNAGRGYAIVKVKKVVDGSETEIGSVQSDTKSSTTSTTGGGKGDDFVLSMSLSLSQTHFEKGDILRITIEGWGWRTGGTSSNIQIGHDPDGRSWEGENDISTIQKHYIPFRLDKIGD